MVEYDTRSSNVSCLLDFPEAYVLFTAWNKSGTVDRTELNALNVKFRNLLGKHHWSASLFPNLRNVINDNHYFSSYFFLVVTLPALLLNAYNSKKISVRWESNTFKLFTWKGDKRPAVGIMIVPNSYKWLKLSVCTFCLLLGWSDIHSVLTHVEAADRFRVAEEKSLLNLCLGIHRNQSACWGVQHHLFVLVTPPQSRPFET